MTTPLHFQSIAHRGTCRKTGVVLQNRWPGLGLCGYGSGEMRVLLSTYGSRGGVQPQVGWRRGGRHRANKVRACAQPDGATAASELRLERMWAR
jgi:hypothetical protein